MTVGWKQKEVAQAQRILATGQLQNPEGAGPFKAFLDAMKYIPTRALSFLDIGCGVGHYGVLIAERFPHLTYTGYDFSPAMIAEAGDVFPGGTFKVKSFASADVENFDIVLVAQVMEYQEEPLSALGSLLTRKQSGFVIAHRLRLTEGVSHRIPSEPTYCGYADKNYLWNKETVLALIKSKAELVATIEWAKNLTVVARCLRDRESYL